MEKKSHAHTNTHTGVSTLYLPLITATRSITRKKVFQKKTQQYSIFTGLLYKSARL